jgi:hypothetical protein
MTPVMLVRKATNRPSGENVGPVAERMLRKRSMEKRVGMARILAVTI